MSALLSYLQIFASYFCGILLYFLPGIITYKKFALLMAVASSIFLLKEIIHNRGKVSKFFFTTAVIYALALMSYRLVTPAIYASRIPDQFNSNFLALFGQVFPGVLTACIIAEREIVQEKIKSWAPYVAVIFTLVALICTLHPASVTSGNLTDNLNGFDYQVVSYVAAYSSGLVGYYLVCRNDVQQLGVFNTKFGAAIALITVFLDLIIILLSGGRGGFVTFVLLAAVTVFFAIKFSAMSARNIVRGLLIVLVAIIGGYVAVKYVNNSSLSTIGLSRIINLLNGGGDISRSVKRATAIASFKNNPIFGHGLGSVFYEIGQYSHNFFTDALVEGGTVLTFLLIVLFVYGLISAVRIIRHDRTDIFWAYVFLCGFFMSMFSGYYLTHLPLWWGLIFVVSKAKNMSHELLE